MKSILVIGIGRFGQHLCENLAKHDNQIMAVDISEEKLEPVLSYVVSAKIGDCTNENVLKSLGISNFDLCFVCIGTNFQSSLEITSAVNMERTIPRASVMANPLTLPLPIAPRTAAARIRPAVRVVLT